MDLLELRTAFYPCCGEDIEVPLEILKPHVDRVIFCDANPDIAQILSKSKAGVHPAIRFIAGNVPDVLKVVPRIDVLFYRCDSAGEGGSGIFVLGNYILHMLLNRMPLSGGMIITDGSNSRQSNFEKMSRCTGMLKHGWRFQPHPNTPLIEPVDGRSYCKDKKLHVIEVTPAIGEGMLPTHFDLSSIYF